MLITALRLRLQSIGGSAVILAISSLLALTGCAADPQTAHESSPPAQGGQSDTYNDEDLHFVQALSPHHDQAIEMSTMMLGKSGVDVEVRTVAKHIQTFHQPQLDTMNTWAWAQVRSAHDDEKDGPAHHGGKDGLMTEDQMEALDLAEHPTAEILYLDGMLRHHDGALAMAEAEARTGQNPDALNLARAVVRNHPTEITTLRDLRTKR